MDIIISIDKEDYNRLKEYKTAPFHSLTSRVYEAIANGTPLPKGHKRLMILSEDKVKENQVNLDFSCQKWISEVDLSNATVTIIEVEKKDYEKKRT